MMKMEFIRPSRVFLLIVIILSFLLASCSNNEKPSGVYMGYENEETGFYLQEFKIKNSELDSITRKYVKIQTLINEEKKKRRINFKDQIFVMDLIAYPSKMPNRYASENSCQDSVYVYLKDKIYFAYTCANDEELLWVKIFRDAYRTMLVYTVCGDAVVVITTNVNDEDIFRYLFGEMLIPTRKRKFLKELYFPQETYTAFYDPLYLCYEYEKGKFVDSIYTLNVDELDWVFKVFRDEKINKKINKKINE